MLAFTTPAVKGMDRAGLLKLPATVRQSPPAFPTDTARSLRGMVRRSHAQTHDRPAAPAVVLRTAPDAGPASATPGRIRLPVRLRPRSSSQPRTRAQPTSSAPNKTSPADR